MDCLLVFNLSRHLILSFIIIYIFFFHSCSLFFFFAFLFLLFFFFSIYGYKRGFGCFNLLPYPPSTYLPKHFGDCRLHQNDMSFEAYIELMGHTLRKPTFNGSWSGGTFQAWFTRPPWLHLSSWIKSLIFKHL